MSIKSKALVLIFGLVIFSGVLGILGKTAEAVDYYVRCSNNAAPVFVSNDTDKATYKCESGSFTIGVGGVGYYDLGARCAGDQDQVIGGASATDRSLLQVRCYQNGNPSNPGTITGFSRQPTPYRASGKGTNAQCFKLVGNPLRAVSVDCESLLGLPKPGGGIIRADFFQDNTCYLAGWGVAQAPANSPRCQSWRNDTGGNDLESANEGSLEDPSRDAAINCNGGECINDNYIVIMAKWIVNILSAVVGVVVVGAIVFAGIQYSSSAGDPGKTAQAKNRIINAIIALIAYMFLFVALQWLIPGGLFG
jgi:hypothetical protein